MIFYLVLGTSSASSCLVGTQADAKSLARERGTSWEQHDVPTDKPGLMAYVNQLKKDVHAEMWSEREDPLGNEASGVLEAECIGEPIKAQPTPGYTEHSVAIDDAWGDLPLARKLHFAALAMEDARRKLK